MEACPPSANIFPQPNTANDKKYISAHWYHAFWQTGCIGAMAMQTTMVNGEMFHLNVGHWLGGHPVFEFRLS